MKICIRKLQIKWLERMAKFHIIKGLSESDKKEN
jgi:hypothetical protein